MNERTMCATALQWLTGMLFLLVVAGLGSQWSAWAQDAVDLPDDVLKAAAKAKGGDAAAQLEELEALIPSTGITA